MDTTLKTITEIMRMPSPAPRPQALAADGDVLWMGSLGTCRLYAIDIAHWTVREETQAPGKPYGVAVMGDELRVLLSLGEEDHRVIRRYVPGHGFKNDHAIDCPDDTGSQLSFDGDRLYVSQWYNKKIISLSPNGTPGSVIDTPHGVCGHVIVGGVFYVLGTDDEESNRYFLTRIDARNGSPKVEDVAHVHFQGRALAYDGSRFWSNHRERHEIVAFTVDGLTP
ncbi:MAG TPA: hypothetical protein VKT72_09855 [Candidatus Baltobacteraceae bacterium]|nr:hypothetical protein [Candidatus Baltobacteraceae bacterium]